MSGQVTMVTLRFLDNRREYKPANYVQPNWAEDWYVPVYVSPAIEMFGNNEVELAEELIQVTSSAEWVGQYRRRIRYGDIMQHGEDYWLFVPAAHQTIFSDNAMPTLRLNEWPQAIITKIKG